MDCPECGLVVTACPRCGARVEIGAAAPEPGRPRASGIPWSLVSGALALLLASAVTIVLAATLLPWGESDGPGSTVSAFLAALGEDRMADLVEMYDPLELEEYGEMLGKSADEVKADMAQGGGMGGTTITFEGLAYSVAVEEGAQVEVTSGTATISGADGGTMTEDMAGARFELVKRDGVWYLRMPAPPGTR